MMGFFSPTDTAAEREEARQVDLSIPQDWQAKDAKGNYELAIETLRHK